jgi:hypothetical protein
MNAGTLSAADTTSYPAGWQPTGPFQGVFSGSYLGGFMGQSAYGGVWSSSVNSALNGSGLRFGPTYVDTNGYFFIRALGIAVRCAFS